MRLRIATRQSPLALWQAEHVKAALQAIDPEVKVELVPLTTTGDRLAGAFVVAVFFMARRLYAVRP